MVPGLARELRVKPRRSLMADADFMVGSVRGRGPERGASRLRPHNVIVGENGGLSIMRTVRTKLRDRDL